MIDKVQKILNEVERLQNELITEKKNGNGSDVDDACILELQNIKNYIKFVQEEPISEDFEEALANEWKGYIDRGAATVDALEDNTQELAFAKGFYRGANWKEQQMMKNAMDVVIGNEWGHPRCVLTQYDLEPLGIRSEDRVKVIVIKDE